MTNKASIAGIVYQNINSPEFFPDLIHHGADLRVGGNIRPNDGTGDSQCFHLGGSSNRVTFGLGIIDNNRGSFFGKRTSNRTANTSATTGNQRHSSIKFH